MSLENKIAIVTGGGAGIGEALCRELARRGARVVVADINGDDADRVATASRRRRAGPGPPRRRGRRAGCQEAGRGDRRRARAPDYLFNNAGIAIGGRRPGPVSRPWRRVLDVDLYGVLDGTSPPTPSWSSRDPAISSTPRQPPACCPAHQRPLLHGQARHRGAVPLAAPGGRRPRGKSQAVCPGYVRTSIYQNTALAGLPRELAARKPVKMIEAAEAAVMILDGVARNHALILFPGYVRWAWRAYRISPAPSSGSSSPG